ncbi:MAG: DUF2953 domain-containing protein [Bacillota bacterium]
MGWLAGALAAGAVLAVAAASVYVVPLRFHVTYRRRGKEEKTVVLVTAWGQRLQYRYQVSGEEGHGPEAGESPASPGEVLSRVRDVLSRAIPALNTARRTGRLFHIGTKKLAHRARFVKVVWRSEIGDPDPARTGIYTGWAWALKGISLGTWQHRLPRPPGTVRVSVKPRFDLNESSTEFICIFELRGGHIINAVLPCLLRFLTREVIDPSG